MPASNSGVDQVFVLVDIDDPLTFDREFQQQIRYSPFVAGGQEFNEANRKAIRSQKEVEELYQNKFILEVYTDKVGEFMQTFLVNTQHQRAIVFRESRYDYSSVERIPADILEMAAEEGVDPEDLMKEQALRVYVYELKSGGPLTHCIDDYTEDEIEGESEEDSDDEDQEEGEGESEEEPSITAEELYYLKEQHSLMMDTLEDRVDSGESFAIQSPKVVH